MESIAVVPLGGRHVNHFWRLLYSLSIPFATLLDIDLGREGAGWTRVKYVLQQLRSIGYPEEDVLQFEHDGNSYSLSTKQLNALHSKNANSSLSELALWRSHLETFGVFFSHPIDVDFLMLRRFPDAYKTSGEGDGPQFPTEDEARELYVRNATLAVTGEEGLQLYQGQDAFSMDLFAWYRYLFLQRSKPSTHIIALTTIGSAQLKSKCPPVFKRLYKAYIDQLHEKAHPDAPNTSK